MLQIVQYLLLFQAAPFLWGGASGQTLGETETVYEWSSVDYDWPSEQHRQQAISNGDFIVENNVITGIKVYKDEVYITVSRWLPGVPSTMNKVIQKDGKPILQPFPSWDWQEIDNCDVFQFTQSMEIDPETGYMWIIDVGSRNIWLDDRINNCPPKLIVYDLNSNTVLHRHVFPSEVLSHKENFVNDIVIDPKGLWAYMSDTGNGISGHQGGIVVYDVLKDKSHRLEHKSMNSEPDGEVIVINGKPYELVVPVDGIALSPDKTQLFYCALGGYHLYQIPTSAAQNGGDISPYVKDLGHKVSQSDGILMGHKGLYFAAMERTAIYAWEYEKDMANQGVGLADIAMETQTNVDSDNVTLIWADTFAMADGWLWSTPNRLPLFRAGELDYSGASGANFRVVKTYVGDKSYLEP